MHKIKGQALSKIKNNTTYQGCSFYDLHKHNDNQFSLVNCHFDHCSFRCDIFIKNLEECSFQNCTFRSRFLLDLSYRNLTSIPNYVYRLNYLTDLVLQGNNIESISPQIANLTLLKNLLLPRNKIESLPEELFELTRLEQLDFGGNRIEQIPRSICKLGRLHILDLTNNFLFDLPEGIAKLPLKSLFLNGNHLTTIAEKILQMPLNQLYIHDNPFVEFYPPWIMFKDLWCGSVGWRMGSAEDWLSTFYSFWDSLSLEEKIEYLDKWKADEDWREFFELRDDFENVYSKKAQGVADTIHIAAEIGNTEQIRIFLEQGIDVNARDTAQQTPLFYSVCNSRYATNRLETTKYLLCCGADVNAIDEFGDTPIFYAVSCEIFSLLIEADTDIQHQNNGGQSILFCCENHMQIEMLLNAGINVGIRDFDGNTPLFSYVNRYEMLFQEKITILQALIKAGIDINAVNVYGETALFKCDNVEIAEALIELGADTSIEDNRGKTASILSRFNGN